MEELWLRREADYADLDCIHEVAGNLSDLLLKEAAITGNLYHWFHKTDKPETRFLPVFDTDFDAFDYSMECVEKRLRWVDPASRGGFELPNSSANFSSCRIDLANPFDFVTLPDGRFAVRVGHFVVTHLLGLLNAYGGSTKACVRTYGHLIVVRYFDYSGCEKFIAADRSDTGYPLFEQEQLREYFLQADGCDVSLLDANLGIVMGHQQFEIRESRGLPFRSDLTWEIIGKPETFLLNVGLLFI